uniref:Myb/SANT-like DNA-binding domain-containing protein n=1 Tax=Amphimedon queenslandica TaxID=400682 RepID=A0A1X7TPP6_AMPQE
MAVQSGAMTSASVDEKLVLAVTDDHNKARESRGRNWGDDEVYELIAVWSDDTIQCELEGSQRNQHVYKKISEHLSNKGFRRTWDQCREKIKKLRKQYKDIVDIHGETGRGRKKFKFFEELDSVLGSRPATKPQIVVSSEAGIECEDDEDQEDFQESPCNNSEGHSAGQHILPVHTT